MISARRTSSPIVVMPFDAELFGHWWYEGPLFLESFIRKAARRSKGVQPDDAD